MGRGDWTGASTPGEQRDPATEEAASQPLATPVPGEDPQVLRAAPSASGSPLHGVIAATRVKAALPSLHLPERPHVAPACTARPGLAGSCPSLTDCLAKGTWASCSPGQRVL